MLSLVVGLYHLRPRSGCKAGNSCCGLPILYQKGAYEWTKGLVRVLELAHFQNGQTNWKRLADRCFLSHSHHTLYIYYVPVAVRDQRSWLFTEIFKTVDKALKWIEMRNENIVCIISFMHSEICLLLEYVILL